MKRWLILIMAVAFLSTAGIAAYAEPVGLAVFHTNDVNARLEPGEGMGYAMAAGYIEAFRGMSPYVLALDAGNLFSADASINASIAEIIDAMEYNAVAPADQDWSLGLDSLKALDEVLNCPMLVGNLSDAKARDAFPSRQIFMLGELSICVAGVNASGSDAYGDAAEAVETIVEELRENVDALIVLCSADSEADALDEIASIDGVDLVIGGVAAKRATNPKVAGAGESLSTLGLVILSIENGTVTNIEKHEIPAPLVNPSPKIEELVRAILAR